MVDRPRLLEEAAGAEVDAEEDEERRLLLATEVPPPMPNADVDVVGAVAGDDDDESLGALTAAASGGAWARRAMQRVRTASKRRIIASFVKMIFGKDCTVSPTINGQL